MIELDCVGLPDEKFTHKLSGGRRNEPAGFSSSAAIMIFVWDTSSERRGKGGGFMDRSIIVFLV